MSREQLPTPPLLPTVASTLPYIPPLDSPVSLSFPQSPSASVQNLTISGQTLVVPSKSRTNSITSSSNQSLSSITPITSPTVFSGHQRDTFSSVMPPPNLSTLRNISSPQLSPQFVQRPILIVTKEVEDLLQQMELQDNAFEATEQRMATSGWSTETELDELRAKRNSVRKEWEERIEVARKNRRGSDAGHSTKGSTSTIENPTLIITLPNSSVPTPHTG